MVSFSKYKHLFLGHEIVFTTREFTHYVLFDLGAEPEIAWPS